MLPMQTPKNNKNLLLAKIHPQVRNIIAPQHQIIVSLAMNLTIPKEKTLAEESTKKAQALQQNI